MEWVNTKSFHPPPGKIVLGLWTAAIMRTVVMREGKWLEAPGYPSKPAFEPPLYWTERPDPPKDIYVGE